MEKRQLVKLVAEICREHSIEWKCFSDEWILQLKANNRVMFIIGYRFPNNNAAADRVCSDKAALSDILQENHIPHVHHTYFMSPVSKDYTKVGGDWGRMKALLNQYGKLVCKVNDGSGGKDVYKIGSPKDLEFAVMKIFSSSESLCLAPFVPVQFEYRVVVINAKIGVIYEKRRPFITGDGISTVEELIKRDKVLKEMETDHADPSYIPERSEIVEVLWKHNLGKGAVPVPVDDSLKKERLMELALTCVRVLDIQFASVDIVESEAGLQILEINSGVMMEAFAKTGRENYQTAKKIYEEAIITYMLK